MSREGEDRVRIGDLFGDLASGVEWVGGSDDRAERHDGEADDGEEDGIGREKHDDVALTNAPVVETRRDGIDGSPEFGKGEVVAGGGVYEGNFAVVSSR